MLKEEEPAHACQSEEKESSPIVLHYRIHVRIMMSMRKKLKKLASAMLRLSRPRGPGDSDRTWPEQLVNVITCLPLILVGARIPIRSISRSVIVLGVVAALYHATPACKASKNQIRSIARKADYWAIAAFSCQIRREITPRLPLPLKHRSLFHSLPETLIGLHSPTMVTLINLSKVESFIRTKPGYLIHLSILTAAGLAFKFEKLPFAKQLPIRLNRISHGLWHLLAALSIRTAIPLLTE